MISMTSIASAPRAIWKARRRPIGTASSSRSRNRGAARSVARDGDGVDRACRVHFHEAGPVAVDGLAHRLLALGAGAVPAVLDEPLGLVGAFLGAVPDIGSGDRLLRGIPGRGADDRLVIAGEGERFAVQQAQDLLLRER